ncbi:MAG: M2 family metallopeptidase [Proteobacteria bacterium]|nr:M2 family metallopeptidase [Pseudomonadota bacterium]
MRTYQLIPLLLATACGGPKTPAQKPDDTAKQQPPDLVAVGSGSGTTTTPVDPRIAQASAFLKRADGELRRVMVAASQAEWANQTDITDPHEAAAAAANNEQNIAVAKLIKEARTFEPIASQLAPDEARMLHVLIYNSGMTPAPDDPKQAEELAKVNASMVSIYGGAEVCGPKDPIDPKTKKKKCKDLDALSEIVEKSRKPAEILAAWTSWHDTVGRAEKEPFSRYVELSNAGARAIGFADAGEMWKAGYDMPADKFAAETDRLWGQVKPLYQQLHCYTQRKLNAMYGDKVVAKTGPIPAHLLGNMWAQQWTWLYPELEPYKGQPKIDVTPTLEKSYTDKKMVEMAEGFYTSLGMNPLPPTFWERSMFQKPDGKKAVCHASAWDVGFNNDLRIKMCIKKTQEDLVTIHHELGHDYYYNNYFQLPILFQSGANDGFHEAIGDTVALSMTPSYLKTRGLLDKVVANDKQTINQQMKIALGKIAFLPFGLLVDRWRWDVFAGTVKPADYNKHWWELREKYQGVKAPTERGAADFDPGAKYHIPANTAYMRYFLAAVLQFQFHRSLCKIAGQTGPLHECSIYQNKEAGAAYMKMLALGASKPWQEALYQVTGQREMDASAILEYFAPLQKWLEEQNKGQACGW